ncbi:hypothetical protein CAPTEDRAFT_214385 [Capitella teleta]|uniref:CUB domain-containing protein n=1 Tax=Capitella teleta TaxID=283909 RepID=R7TG73_CAPTE|nr:hypothetical protein CAPTEDRAFT_214385 [Capitella teleta]|eukprot:ELT92783.1 hypothetical protein CAPTEDRAFT_214385 [Capitella teleta]
MGALAGYLLLFVVILVSAREFSIPEPEGPGATLIACAFETDDFECDNCPEDSVISATFRRGFDPLFNVCRFNRSAACLSGPCMFSQHHRILWQKNSCLLDKSVTKPRPIGVKSSHGNCQDQSTYLIAENYKCVPKILVNYCNGTKTASHSSGYFMNRLFPVLEPGTTSCSLRINLNSTQHLTLKTLVRDVHILNFQHHDCVRYLKLTLTKNSNKQEIVFYEDINANYNADQIEITFYNDCLGSSPTARYRYLIYYKVSNGVPLNLTEWTDATLNPIEPGTVLSVPPASASPRVAPESPYSSWWAILGILVLSSVIIVLIFCIVVKVRRSHSNRELNYTRPNTQKNSDASDVALVKTTRVAQWVLHIDHNLDPI